MVLLSPHRAPATICHCARERSSGNLSSGRNLRRASVFKLLAAVTITLLASTLDAQNAPPCALNGTTYPCTIGGTLLLPTAPTGNLFGGGGGGGGGGRGGGG